MIIALVVILLGGGGGNGDMWSFPPKFNDQVKIIIIDEDRQKTVTSTYQEMEKSKEDYYDRIEDLSKSLWELLDKPEVKNSEFEDLKNRVIEERADLADKMISNRIELVNHIEKAEWITLFTPGTDTGN